MATSYEVIGRTSEIPVEVRDLFGCPPGPNCAKVIAEVDEPYNATDLIDPRLPGKRLGFAGASPTSVFVFYAQGGLATTRHLVIARIESNRVTESADFLVYGSPGSIEELKSLVPQNLRPYGR